MYLGTVKLPEFSCRIDEAKRSGAKAKQRSKDETVLCELLKWLKLWGIRTCEFWARPGMSSRDIDSKYMYLLVKNFLRWHLICQAMDRQYVWREIVPSHITLLTMNRWISLRTRHKDIWALRLLGLVLLGDFRRRCEFVDAKGGAQKGSQLGS